MFTLEDVVPKVERAGIKAIPYTIPDEGKHCQNQYQHLNEEVKELHSCLWMICMLFMQP